MRSHQNDAHVGSYMFLIWTSWINLRNAGMPLQYCTFQYVVVPVYHVYRAIPFIDSSGLSFIISNFPTQIRDIKTLYLISEKAIKIFFYEIKLGKSRTTLSYCPNTYFIRLIRHVHHFDVTGHKWATFALFFCRRFLNKL